MTFRRWKVLKYKRLKVDAPSEENEVSMIINSALQEITVYCHGKQRENVTIPKDPEEFPKLRIRDLNLYIMLNSKFEGFRVTFNQENLSEISKSVEKFGQVQITEMKDKFLRIVDDSNISQCSSPLSLPSVLGSQKIVNFSQDVFSHSESAKKVDKSVQTDDLLDELLENEDFITACLKNLIENEDFHKIVELARGQDDLQRFSDSFEKKHPELLQTPPSLEHHVSENEFDAFFSQSNI